MANASNSNHPRFWQRIQGQLILLLLVLLVPTLLIQAYVYNDRLERARASELQANLELARSLAKAFEAFVEDILHQEATIGLALTLAPPISPEEKHRVLDSAQAEYPSIWNFAWVSPEGLIVTGTHLDSTGQDLNDRPHIRRILAGSDWAISDLILTKTTSEPAFTIARAVRDKQNVLLGIVIAVILPDRLGPILGIKRFPGGGHALVDTNGMMVYRNPAIKATWEERNWVKDYPEFGEALKGHEVATRVYAPFEGKTRLVGFTPVASIGWAASAGRTEEIALESASQSLWFHASLFAVVVIFAFGLALVLSRRIANSVHKVRNHALAIGHGEAKNPAIVTSPSEIVELADSLDQMAQALKVRETALRESAFHLAKSQQLAHLGSWSWDIAEGRLYWSDETYRMFGFQPGEFAPQYGHFLSLLHPEDRDRVDRAIQNALVEGRYNPEFRIIRTGGEERCLHSVGETTFDEDGNPVKMDGYVHDITERKGVEAALLKSEQKFRRMYESGMLGVIFWNMDGKLIDSNDKFLQMLGYDREDLIEGRISWIDMTPTEYRYLDEASIKELKAAGVNSAPFEKEYFHKDGSCIPVIVVGAMLDEARVDGVAFVMDITERKQAEAQVAADLKALTIMHELSGRLIETGGLQLLLQEIMNAGVAIVGSEMGTLQLLEGDSLRIVASYGHQQEFLDFFASAESQASVCGEATRRGERVVVSDVETSPLFAGTPSLAVLREAGVRAVQSTPMMSREGELVGILTTQWKVPYNPDEHDLWRIDLLARQAADLIVNSKSKSALRKSHEELELRIEERTAELHRSNQALQDFASIASHDMQEPLRKVISFGNMLRQKNKDSLGVTGNDYLNRMLEATRRMQTLLTSLLEYSRVTMYPEPFKEVDLYDIIHEVLSDLEIRIQKSGGEVHVGELPTIKADPTQMRQLFQNLIGNALKFHKQGEKPVVKVHCTPSSNSDYLIIVEDSGIGFDEECGERIFAPFQRLCGRSEYEGTGMGLAICKKIVERHGGSITAKGTPGTGSTFILTLPVSQRGGGGFSR
jgi:PAS domain S-box-containing protein